MSEPTDIYDAPGISLKTLFRSAEKPALLGIIGSSAMDIIRELEPDLSSDDDRLGELATSLTEPSEALRDAEMRERIIRMLPLRKARELGGHMAVADGRTLYDDLCARAADKPALKT